MVLHQHDDFIDIADVVGPFAWGVIHHAMESFPCAPCAENGGKLGRGVHDVVNFHTGKPLQHPEDLEFLRVSVNQVPPQIPPAHTASNPLDEEIIRLAREVEILGDGEFRSCNAAERERFESCVRQVKEQGTAESPFAVCTVSIGCSPRSRK